VEESGNAPSLKERLDLDGPFEALHLSCHGDIPVAKTFLPKKLTKDILPKKWVHHGIKNNHLIFPPTYAKVLAWRRLMMSVFG